ncbi:uncharacterized protein LOC144910547 [Branchiostoma floridae x Branchiostoma belcheri]
MSNRFLSIQHGNPLGLPRYPPVSSFINMASVVYLFLFLVVLGEVKSFPADVNEVGLSKKEKTLLKVLNKKYKFNEEEVEATKELIEDEKNDIDPEQDKIIFRLQVEEIVRKLRTMTDEEMIQIKSLFVRKMGVERAEQVFQEAEELYESEKAANEELEKSFQLNKGEEEAFEELVEDTADGKDPETEDIEFKLGLSELADGFAKLTPEQEERFSDLVEEELGSEEAAKIFQEIKKIHEELEALKGSANGDDAIRLAAGKINTVADDRDNRKFWDELDVEVPDNDTPGDNIDNDMGQAQYADQAQHAGDNPDQAQHAGDNPDQAQYAGANPDQAQYAGANPEHAEKAGVNPVQVQSAGADSALGQASAANTTQGETPGVNLSQVQAAGVTASQVQTADTYPFKTSTVSTKWTETNTTAVSNDDRKVPEIGSEGNKTEANVTPSNVENIPTASAPVIGTVVATTVSNDNSSVTSFKNVANNSEDILRTQIPVNKVNTSQPSSDSDRLEESPINDTSSNATGTFITTTTVANETQSNVSISEEPSVEGSESKLRNISGTPTAAPYAANNVTTVGSDDSNGLNNITTQSVITTEVNTSGQSDDDNSSDRDLLGDVPVTAPVPPTADAGLVPSTPVENSNGKDQTTSAATVPTYDTVSARKTEDNSTETDHASATNDTTVTGDFTDEELEKLEQYDDWFDVDYEDWTTIPWTVGTTVANDETSVKSSNNTATDSEVISSTTTPANNIRTPQTLSVYDRLEESQNNDTSSNAT